MVVVDTEVHCTVIRQALLRLFASGTQGDCVVGLGLQYVLIRLRVWLAYLGYIYNEGRG
jgi:hypothetical protein